MQGSPPGVGARCLGSLRLQPRANRLREAPLYKEGEGPREAKLLLKALCTFCGRFGGEPRALLDFVSEIRKNFCFNKSNFTPPPTRCGTAQYRSSKEENLNFPSAYPTRFLMRNRRTKIKTHAEGDEFIGEKGIHAENNLECMAVNVANSKGLALLRYDGRGNRLEINEGFLLNTSVVRTSKPA